MSGKLAPRSSNVCIAQIIAADPTKHTEQLMMAPQKPNKYEKMVSGSRMGF